jgi:hypothetical protein
MNIIQRLWWSLGRGNPVVPSRWQATDRNGAPRTTKRESAWLRTDGWLSDSPDDVQRSQVQILPPLPVETAGQRRFPERSGSRL